MLLDFEVSRCGPSQNGRCRTSARDVAGMLRSFDYVGGTLELDLG